MKNELNTDEGVRNDVPPKDLNTDEEPKEDPKLNTDEDPKEDPGLNTDEKVEKDSLKTLKEDPSIKEAFDSGALGYLLYNVIACEPTDKEKRDLLALLVLLFFREEENYEFGKNISLKSLNQIYAENKYTFYRWATKTAGKMRSPGGGGGTPSPAPAPSKPLPKYKDGSVHAVAQAATVAGSAGGQGFTVVNNTVEYDDAQLKAFDLHLQVFDELVFTREEWKFLRELLEIQDDDQPGTPAFEPIELLQQMKRMNHRTGKNSIQMEELFSSNADLKARFDFLMNLFEVPFELLISSLKELPRYAIKKPEMIALSILSYAADDISDNLKIPNFMVRLGPNVFRKGKPVSVEEMKKYSENARKTLAKKTKERSRDEVDEFVYYYEVQKQKNDWFYIPYKDTQGRWKMLTPNDQEYQIEVENLTDRKARINTLSIDGKDIHKGYAFPMDEKGTCNGIREFECFQDTKARFKTAIADSDKVAEEKSFVETKKLGVIRLEVVPQKLYRPSIPVSLPRPTPAPAPIGRNGEPVNPFAQYTGTIVSRYRLFEDLMRNFVVITGELTKNNIITWDSSKSKAMTTLGARVINNESWMISAKNLLAEHVVFRAKLMSDHRPDVEECVRDAKDGFTWPHAPEIRVKLEKAGFRYSPTVLRQDRCECPECKADTESYQTWQDLPKKHKPGCKFRK